MTRTLLNGNSQPKRVEWQFSMRNPLRLTFGYWEALDDDLKSRLNRLQEDSKHLSSDLKRANSFQIAATDLFVEKAQIHLTIRARIYAWSGAVLGFVCIVFLGAVLYLIYDFRIEQFSNSLSWQVVVLFALRAAGLAAFAGGAVYFLASLSRALLP